MTPWPTMTDDLLPTMTLGCGEARLDFVPSGQMMASPVKTPRLPSSQVTSLPCLVQFCAIADPAQQSAIAKAAIPNASFCLMLILSPPGEPSLKSVVGLGRFLVHRGAE